MAAPTLLSEGTISVNTSGTNSPTIPSHVADDILVCVVGYWGPNTPLTNNLISFPTAPTGWNKFSSVAATGLSTFSSGDIGIFDWYWFRATGAGTTVTVSRPVGETGQASDTGTDTAFSARVYVIRGAETTGNPFDDNQVTATLTSANGSVDAVTVSGTERMVVHFFVAQDDVTPTATGWTAGTAATSTTGTDAGQQTLRKDNVSASTSADAMTVSAPAQGHYAVLGVSFKPTTAAAFSPVDPMGMSGIFGL
jgi:hypothetical protein